MALSISRNFDAITIEADGTTVRVTGTTKEEVDGVSTLAEEPKGVAIYVAIVGLADQRESLVKQAVVASSGSSWNARFLDAASKVEDRLSVQVVGLALHEGDDPFVWEEVLPLSARKP